MGNKTAWVGTLILVIGFIMFYFTFNVVYNNYYYQELLFPFIHIIGEILMISGLYLMIKGKESINKFLKPTKWKVILSLTIFIVLSIILLNLWSNLPERTLICQAIGCAPIFWASRTLARFTPLILVLSYLLSCLIIYNKNKMRRIK